MYPHSSCDRHDEDKILTDLAISLPKIDVPGEGLLSPALQSKDDKGDCNHDIRQCFKSQDA